MCGTTITDVEGRYKVWIDSRSGRGADSSLLTYDNIPIFNIHPKFKQSLVYVKTLIIGEPAAVNTASYVVSIKGKSFPNNFQTQRIGQVRLQHNSDAINSDTNSRVVCCAKEEVSSFGGSAKHDGILCGDTFVNAGSFSVEILGLANDQDHYLMELDIELVENVRTENPNAVHQLKY
tara:strand:+ start:1156 stop:1686 length:531 start_codon:yes stop_codon:yes gene_type:complete